MQLGLTWGAPVYLDAQLGLHGLLLGPGNGIQLPDGKLLAIGFGNGAAQWPNASRMDDAAIVSSTDHGHHWNLSYIFQGVPPSSLVEPAIALLPNGSVLANFRTTMARGGGVRPTAAFARATSMSHDGGASWVHTNKNRIFEDAWNIRAVSIRDWSQAPRSSLRPNGYERID